MTGGARAWEKAGEVHPSGKREAGCVGWQLSVVTADRHSCSSLSLGVKIVLCIMLGKQSP